MAAPGVAAGPAGPAEMPQAQALPGMPLFIPVAPRPGFIVAGLVLVALGIWALAAYLPAHEPPPAGLDSDYHALSEEAYYAGSVAALTLILAGVAMAIYAALYRAHAQVLCRVCHQQVIGWKYPFGLMCPLGKHYARVSWLVLIATTGFWSLGIVMLAVLTLVVVL